MMRHACQDTFATWIHPTNVQKLMHYNENPMWTIGGMK
jgi:hypothetical protein